MIEHLGINTPYFGILLSLIPFVIATYFYKRRTGSFISTFICQYGCRDCIFKSNWHQLSTI